LHQKKVKASFFLTGNFYRNPEFKSLIRQLKRDGHYLGAHSDKHLLYCDWTRRDSLLVTRDDFERDLNDNYHAMSSFGIEKKDAPFFLPPFEWYNSTITSWTKDQGLHLINFSPGTRSPADYTFPEMNERYLPSEKIYRSIIDCEVKDPNGMNGFILLIHIGTDPRRTDKFYDKLDELIDELKKKGYRFVRVDELLD
jgi:peptidoglycan/xylan/chitin deacetylase (PgdA/CDA1 family)